MEQYRQHEDKVLLILTLLIGATVGLVVVAFILLTENLGARMYPAGGAAWRRFVVPVAGSLVTGFLLLKYFPNARGSGIPQTKTALFLQSGIIHLRTVLGKFFCSSISLASGIALGREGPSVQVGAGIASVLGRQFGLSPANVKALVPIGASAALAAAFNTPIAAVLFTLEEVLGNLHARVLGAIVISSATSWMVLHLLLGDEPLFHVPAYQLVHPIEFIFYAVLGAVGGLVSVAFVKLLLALRSRFLKMPAWTAALQPVAGGLMVGILGLFVPAVLGVGYGHVSEALNGGLAFLPMALLVILKLVATATCYASGNAGGIFGPSLFIGAMMGGAFGFGAHFIVPDYTGSVGAYALVGMGATFAGIIRVPMTSVIMIFEITRDYSIIVPLMIANLISYFISSRLQRKPIYEALMQQDGIQLPAMPRERETSPSIEKAVRMPERILLRTDGIQDALSKLPSTGSAWPVIGANGLLGMVSRARLQEAAVSPDLPRMVGDLLPAPGSEFTSGAKAFTRAYPDQSLQAALVLMNQSGMNVLPVVSRANPNQLLGVVGLDDIAAAFDPDRDFESVMPRQQIHGSTKVGVRGILGVLIIAVTMAGFLGYFYRSQRATRGAEYTQAGNQLMEKNRYQEAVERYRSALSISHKNEDKLALATALAKAGRWREAKDYFSTLAREMPNSGRVNLGLGRIAIKEGDVRAAIEYFHRAIYGLWPGPSEPDRTQIRTELIEFLGNNGYLTQVRLELLSLVAESPEDLGTRKRIAHLLLSYGMAKESAQLFQEITQNNPQEADAYAGLGQAEFMLGDYVSAQKALKSALQANSEELKSKQQLELVEQILALNPSLRGLKTFERYERSRKLLEEILRSLDQCLAGQTLPLSAVEAETVNDARTSIASKKKPHSYGDALERTMNLAEQLWKVRVQTCGQAAAADDALGILTAHLFR